MATGIIFFRTVCDFHSPAVSIRQLVRAHAVFSPTAALHATDAGALVDSAGCAVDADATRPTPLDTPRSSAANCTECLGQVGL